MKGEIDVHSRLKHISSDFFLSDFPADNDEKIHPFDFREPTTLEKECFCIEAATARGRLTVASSDKHYKQFSTMKEYDWSTNTLCGIFALVDQRLILCEELRRLVDNPDWTGYSTLRGVNIKEPKMVEIIEYRAQYILDIGFSNYVKAATEGS